MRTPSKTRHALPSKSDVDARTSRAKCATNMQKRNACQPKLTSTRANPTRNAHPIKTTPRLPAKVDVDARTSHTKCAPNKKRHACQLNLTSTRARPHEMRTPSTNMSCLPAKVEVDARTSHTKCATNMKHEVINYCGCQPKLTSTVVASDEFKTRT